MAVTAAFLHHGGRLAEAARLFGGTPEDWLDLSTGLNPVPWPAPASINWTALPDPEALTALEHTAARHFGVDPALVCAVPGSEIGLRLLAQVLALPARTLTPCYRTHNEAFAAARPIAFGAATDGAEAVVLANPNNPDGLLRPAAEVLNWHARIVHSSGWIIVDEAFADCHPETSVAAQVHPQRRLVVLRSFGKFFGLAGLRVGFVLAPPAVLGAIRRLLGSWPIHTAALALGTAAYNDSAWIAQTRRALPYRALALDQVLARHSLEPRGACPLFRYVITSAADEVFAQLAAAHILVRPFAENPQALRFGVPADPHALRRLDKALADG